MAPRWILWVLATVVLPIPPWFTSEYDDGRTPILFMIMTGFAIVCQVWTSIAVGIGLGRKRALSTGGTVGMSILFTVISLAVATGIWLLSMMIFIMMLYEKKGV